jgi:hypothetical protein
LNDIFDGGVVLQRGYGVESVLSLWHFAYNGGGEVELYRGCEAGLDEAFGYWSGCLREHRVPAQLVSSDGCVYERGWYRLNLS